MADDNIRVAGAVAGIRAGAEPKVCIFCQDHRDWVDYKDVGLLRRFMTDRGTIRSQRLTGNCPQHQRGVATAIKTARELALLPITQRASSDGGRRLTAPKVEV